MELLASLDERDWAAALTFLDRSQLTLHFGAAAGGRLPRPVRERIDGNLRDNTARAERVRRDVVGICEALEAAGAEFLVLKGFLQWPRFVADPRLRTQYDLDLFCSAESLDRARVALIERGYEPVEGFETFPIDHLPTMVRNTGFEWRGNYFDPEIPVCVDIHFRLWDEETERFCVPGLHDFWARRTRRSMDGRTIPELCPADALGYACLHLLRHILRGSMRLCHAHEIAYFLHTNSGGDAFWQEWRALHDPGLRRLEAIAFLLAERWFGCELPEAARQEAEALP